MVKKSEIEIGDKVRIISDIPTGKHRGKIGDVIGKHTMTGSFLVGFDWNEKRKTYGVVAGFGDDEVLKLTIKNMGSVR